MVIVLVVIALLVAGVYMFMQNSSFGQLPKGERQHAIQRSANFKDGQFQNLSPTPALSEGSTYYSVLKEFLFEKHQGKIPLAIPTKKTDLLSLDPNEDIIVWFGHSSYFLQVDGKKILVDPVLSSNASPLSFTTKSFEGTNLYTTEELPSLDYILVSHDHWDHLDYRTIIKLKGKFKQLICGLGVGAYLERWGFDQAAIIERDWNESVDLENGFKLDILPARHFSGRGFKRNTALWVSFALTTPTKKLYLGGDSGYDEHFRRIGNDHGPFDLAILECGQYDKSWKYIHMMPEEVVEAALDLKAARLLPVHWGKFSLGNHAWNDSIIRVSAAANQKSLPLITPQIGEAVQLDTDRAWKQWWVDAK